MLKSRRSANTACSKHEFTRNEFTRIQRRRNTTLHETNRTLCSKHEITRNVKNTLSTIRHDTIDTNRNTIRHETLQIANFETRSTRRGYGTFLNSATSIFLIFCFRSVIFDLLLRLRCEDQFWPSFIENGRNHVALWMFQVWHRCARKW